MTVNQNQNNFIKLQFRFTVELLMSILLVGRGHQFLNCESTLFSLSNVRKSIKRYLKTEKKLDFILNKL